ncbi:cell surface protein SprA [Larkinella terrae]|uniref:T9SS outer membrane translocon Sov/SprA n=1 Tax=Larkinella terrae TaxID=2025311 RepID=UPI001E5D8F26|nr:cell surface protein SprA [Larkinella terrae]
MRLINSRIGPWLGVLCALILGSAWTHPLAAQTPAQRRPVSLADSIARARQDSIRATRTAERRPIIRWRDRYVSPFSISIPKSPFLLRDPKAVSTDIQLSEPGQISVLERIGSQRDVTRPNSATATAPAATTGATIAPVGGTNPAKPSPGLPYRPAETMSYEDYNRLQNQRVQKSLWREYSARNDGQSAVSGRGLVPKLELPPVFDRLFGGNLVDFKPNGFVLLDFGYLYQFIDNPLTPVLQRRNGNFRFDEQININFNGKIGERLGVTANYDTKSSFNFENVLKLNYRPPVPALPNANGLTNGLPGLPSTNGLTSGLPTAGSLMQSDVPQFQAQDPSIIQGLEAGNISWPLSSQLIPGVQNLFGVKTQLRFGKLYATVVASQQRSKQDEITIKGGSLQKNYEIRVDSYDENRHFFLSQFFRNNYERALNRLPQIMSGVTITRLEVYVTNRTNTTTTLRNIVGFADLAEPQPFNTANPNVQPVNTNPASPADNATGNGLFTKLKANAAIRQVDQVNALLDGSFGFAKGIDYELLRGAKRLTETEYKFQPELGYISLVTPLRNDEVLAVSYEYTYQGRKYQVGELTEDYQSRQDNEVLILKLLKSSTIRNNTQLPMWNLMMKNIYSLNTTQINKQNFQLRVVYKDDLTGIDNPNLQESQIKDIPLVQVFNMDQVNAQLDPQKDGNFDFVEGVTVDSRYGRVIFPVLEPFGSYLSRKLGTGTDADVFRAKYVYNELYRTTLVDAQQVAGKNKFFLKGSYQSSTAGDVSLPYGVDEKSVQVTAGGVPLSPGVDFVVESQIGRVRFLNESMLNSGQEIKVRFERPDLFQNQIRRLVGTRLDYKLSPEVNLGMTAMNMRETPAGFLTRVAIGNEPVNNTILGFDAMIRKDSRLLTKLLDGLPLIQTKELSTVAFQGEVAQLFPGVAPRVNNNAFIDDFEAARTLYDLTRQPTRWRLGSTPTTPERAFPQGTFAEPLGYAFNRARISVYTVDNTFSTSTGIASNRAPQNNLTDNDLKNFYEQFFLSNELFKGRSARLVNLPENILDVAYFPRERGMYNFNPNLAPDGRLAGDPRKNFGSVMRAISSDADFDNANIENIEFWLMDPFLGAIDAENAIIRDGFENKANLTGGKLIFNLGDISEDVVKDSRYGFENGLAVPNGLSPDSTAWGRVTRSQFVTQAFDNVARPQQDVGLDGLSNRDENRYFKSYIDQVSPRLNAQARERLLSDPANDDFIFYYGQRADSVKYIVSRYKQYMGMENNSPESQDRNQLVTPASTTLPDIEDLNTDNTINDNEAYYEYEVDLRPGQLAVGKGYIVDKVDVQSKAGKPVTWYLFRIPVRDNPRKVGNINGFKSMRFARMYLTDFSDPVVLRFAQLQMTSNQYRKYTGDLSVRGLQEVPEPYDAQFKVAAVNIEENSAPGNNKYIYRVPPGFQRDRDFTQINQVELNEQSMSLSVTNLRDGDSRAAFKNTNLDLLFRERLKMFIHMHNEEKESGQVSAFVRLGTDFTDNYYEIEIPKLVNTPEGTQPDDVVWPAANDLDIAIDELINLKAEKNRQFTRSSQQPFSMASLDGRYNLTVVGNPDLSAVQVVMIGVRNPKSPDEQAKSFTVWVDELRANGFDQTAGRAAVGVLNAKLADVATVTASGKVSTFGFGGVQQRISERSRETTTEYGIQSQISVDKLLPEKWGLRIPLYVNYDKRLIQPHFNPLDPDTPLETTLSTLNENEREKYRRLVEDNSIRRGFNLSNLRKVKTNPNAKNHFYDVENLSFTYAFNEATRTNILTEQYVQKQTRGGLAYVYSAQPKPFEPFKRFESLERPYLRWLRDFNLTLLPTQVQIRGEVDRSFIKTQLRNSELTTAGMVPQFEKFFWFNRYYDLQWNLTRNLIFTYNARANAIIDEPAGDLNTQAKIDSVWANAKRFGRTKNFEQNMRTTYRMPLDKIPLLDWVAADLTYNIGYQFQANSFGITDTLNVPFGNTIKNNREWGVQGRVDFIRLYNKIKSLRFANTPSVPRKNFTRNPGDIEDIQRSESRVLKSFVRTLLTIRGINFNYTIQESTILPGFLPTPRFFGLSRENAPGLPFVLGSQDRAINRKASERGWLSHSTVQNQPFTQTRGKKFDARTTLEPFKDFRITVEARLTRQDSYQEIYRPDTIGGSYKSLSPYRNGQFSMSFLSFKTAFSKLNKDNSSPIFDRFAEYRKIILNRLTRENPESGNGGQYNLTSQDVLIPAFFAAYSGKDPNTVDKNPFLRFPLPNWRVDYNGLSQLKPFRKLFSAFTLSHSYNSTYSVGNFTSSLDYEAMYVNLAVMNYPLASRYNIDRQFVPVFVMSTITMTERFAPLLGITFRTQSKISGGLEYNQDRSVALNLSNAQVAELSNKDITFRFGFTKTNFKVPFKINGAYKRLKNDLTFNCNLTFRDTRTVQRKFDDSSTTPTNVNGVGEQIITAGNVNFQLRPQVSYVVSRRLNVQVYFDRTFNDPLVSNSYRRATTAGGVQVRFNLAE